MYRVALNTGTTVQVVEYGTAVVIVNTATPTVGDLVTCVAGTLGYGTDSGVIPVSGVALGVQIVGRIISVGTAGASTTPVTVQLFGPGVAGTGWLPLVNGFYQFPGTSPGNATYTDAYTYKMCAPNTGMPPSLCTPPFVPTTGLASSYAGFWMDRGGFGLGLPAAGTTAVAPADYELLRLSAVTQQYTRENTLEIFNFTQALSLGSVPGSFFNEAGTPGKVLGHPEIFMYGINTHTSGCSGTKCGGSMSPYTDYDIRQIGIESDVEERSGSTKTSSPSLGVYSVCVNCNNSGSGSGASFNPNIAFLADSNVANNAGATTAPWGTAFETTPGAALTGVLLNPINTSGPSNAQPFTQCAYTDASKDQACTTLATTSASLFSVGAPGLTRFGSTAGVQASHFAGFSSTPGIMKGTALSSMNSATISGNDFNGTVAISAGTVSVGTIFIVTFANQYTNSVRCLVAPNSNTVQIGVGHTDALMTLSITSATAGAAANYSFDYFCAGY